MHLFDHVDEFAKSDNVRAVKGMQRAVVGAKPAGRRLFQNVDEHVVVGIGTANELALNLPQLPNLKQRRAYVPGSAGLDPHGRTPKAENVIEFGPRFLGEPRSDDAVTNSIQNAPSALGAGDSANQNVSVNDTVECWTSAEDAEYVTPRKRLGGLVDALVCCTRRRT
jgi:hypothetical protein